MGNQMNCCCAKHSSFHSVIMAEDKCWTDITKIDKDAKRMLRTEFHQLVQEAFEMGHELEHKRHECEQMFHKYLMASKGSLHPTAFLGPLNELDIWHWTEGHYAPLVLKKECKIKHGKFEGRSGRVSSFDPSTHTYKIELLKEESDELVPDGDTIDLPRREFKVQVVVDYFQTVFAEINAEKDSNFYSWLSEFFDLILVAAVFKMADSAKTAVKSDLSAKTPYFDMFVIYFLFFNAFLVHTMVWTRFTDVEGEFDDILHQLFGLGMLMMACFIPKESRMFAHPEGIFMGWGITVTALLTLHIYYYYIVPDPSCDRYCRRRIVALFLSLILSCIVFFIDNGDLDSYADHCGIIFIFSALPIFITEVNSVRMSCDELNTTTEFLSERFGIFSLILMGESIFALALTNMETVSSIGSSSPGSYDSGGSSSYDGGSSASGDYHTYSPTYMPTYDSERRFLAGETSYGSSTDPLQIDFGSSKVWETVLVIILAYLLLMLVYMLYFNGHIGQSEYGFHALDNAGFPGSMSWVFAHCLFGYFLVFLGLGLKLLVYSIEQGKDKYLKTANDVIFLAIICIVICLYFIRASHKQFTWHRISWIGRGGTWLMLFFGFLNHGGGVKAEEIVGIAVALMFVIVVLDIYLKPTEDREKEIEHMEHEIHGHQTEHPEYNLNSDNEDLNSLHAIETDSLARSPSVHNYYTKVKGAHRSRLVDTVSMMEEGSNRRSQGIKTADLRDFQAMAARGSMTGLVNHIDSDEETDSMELQIGIPAADYNADFDAEADSDDHTEGRGGVELQEVDSAGDAVTPATAIATQLSPKRGPDVSDTDNPKAKLPALNNSGSLTLPS